MTFTADGINVEITRKKIKNMHLYVSANDGSVRASVPHRLSDEQVESFILSKLDWIKKHREQALQKAEESAKYQDGDTVYLFGAPYTLRVEMSEKKPTAYVEGEEIILLMGKKAAAETRKKLLDELYKKELSEKLEIYLKKWEDITHLKCTAFSIRDMKTRWGSCSVESGRMRFNLELAKKPQELIEYVVLHELAHRKVSNHGARFQELLDKYMPDWRERRAALSGRRKKS